MSPACCSRNWWVCGSSSELARRSFSLTSFFFLFPAISILFARGALYQDHALELALDQQLIQLASPPWSRA